MIDVGGPSMLRAAAKNFVARDPGVPARAVRPRAGRAARRRHAVARHAAHARRRRRSRRRPRTTRRSRPGSATIELFPQQLTLSFQQGRRPRVRREPAPARRLLRRGGPAPAPALARRAARRQGALVQQPRRPRGRAPRRARVHAAGRGDRQARRTRAASRSRGRSRRRTSARSRPIRSRRSAACSSLNRPVGGALGARIAEHFVEVLLAPDFDADAIAALREKPALRLLCDRERRMETPGERDYKRVLGGLLVQERDVDVDDRQLMTVVAGSVSEEQWGDLLFAWRVCKHVSSNAIVLAKGLQTIGIGAGQMSRVDAVRIAFEKARELGHDPTGAVLASDAFFPFADGPQLALDAGVAALIQPGGSKRDDEVIAARCGSGGGRRRMDRSPGAAALSRRDDVRRQRRADRTLRRADVARRRDPGRVARPASAIRRRSSGSTGSPADGSRRHDPREARVPEPRRLGEGPHRARDDRGGRARRAAQARRDDRRADLGQHRRRARDRGGAQGLPLHLRHARQDVEREDRDAARLRRRGRDHADRGRATTRPSPTTPSRRGSPRRSPAASSPTSTRTWRTRRRTTR